MIVEILLLLSAQPTVVLCTDEITEIPSDPEPPQEPLEPVRRPPVAVISTENKLQDPPTFQGYPRASLPKHDRVRHTGRKPMMSRGATHPQLRRRS